MPERDADAKAARLLRLTSLFAGQPGRGWKAVELAAELGCDRRTVLRDIAELDRAGRLPLYQDGHRWRLVEGGRVALDALALDLREGMALYLAARLLAQQTDEYNLHVMNALDKLIGAMPPQLAPGLRGLASALAVRQSRGDGYTEIFSALVLGWAHRRLVSLRYRPPRAASAYGLRLAPYLFEPSGIGRTIYVIGAVLPGGALRTFKLERVLAAQLTDEPFAAPEGFDGAALLARAWGVMYGEGEPVEVHLRFSRFVAPRVKETVWHPSQRISDLPDGGCEWRAAIGDALEIGPWVRGWGRDCEVLAPEGLRRDLATHVRHLARTYDVQRGSDDERAAEERAALDDIFG